MGSHKTSGAALPRAAVPLPPPAHPLAREAEPRAPAPSGSPAIGKTRGSVTLHNVCIYSAGNEDFFIFLDDFCSQEDELRERLYPPEFLCSLLLSHAPNLRGRLWTNAQRREETPPRPIRGWVSGSSRTQQRTWLSRTPSAGGG